LSTIKTMANENDDYKPTEYRIIIEDTVFSRATSPSQRRVTKSLLTKAVSTHNPSRFTIMTDRFNSSGDAYASQISTKIGISFREPS
jgi:hypothetical protein